MNCLVTEMEDNLGMTPEKMGKTDKSKYFLLRTVFRSFWIGVTLLLAIFMP